MLENVLFGGGGRLRIEYGIRGMSDENSFIAL